ncbi:MAG: TetR/AcrR family transcriptional regulator [Microthrixaceae bacterium]|nr:TetR/AcrR family transcriptional regulator [Microthrixaceae bacterium]
MQRQLTQRGQERKAQLVSFAIKAFAQNGYHTTSVADIVDGVGVGKGVFYWYFSSKEELFIEILRTSQRDMRRRQQREIRGVEDPLDRIDLGIRAAVLWFAENDDLRRLLEFARNESTFASAVHHGQKVLVEDARTHIEEGIKEGRIPPRDPEALALAMLAVANQLTQVYISERNEDPEVVADTVAEFCRGGLGMSPEFRQRP